MKKRLNLELVVLLPVRFENIGLTGEIRPRPTLRTFGKPSHFSSGSNAGHHSLLGHPPHPDATLTPGKFERKGDVIYNNCQHAYPGGGGGGTEDTYTYGCMGKEIRLLPLRPHILFWSFPSESQVHS